MSAFVFISVSAFVSAFASIFVSAFVSVFVPPFVSVFVLGGSLEESVRCPVMFRLAGS